MCHVSVHSGALAFFDRFSDFNHLFELLDQILLPIAVVPFIGIKLKKHFKNVHCEHYEQFSCRKRMFPIQSHPRRSGILLFPDCPRFCRLMKTRNRRYPRSSRIDGDKSGESGAFLFSRRVGDFCDGSAIQFPTNENSRISLITNPLNCSAPVPYHT